MRCAPSMRHLGLRRRSMGYLFRWLGNCSYRCGNHGYRVPKIDTPRSGPQGQDPGRRPTITLQKHGFAAKLPTDLDVT